MIELLVVLSTMCPAGYGSSCYQKMEIERKGESVKVISSTVVARCEIDGHRFVQGPDHFYPEYISPGDWRCSVCGTPRKYKTRKREVEDRIPDDGPKDQVDDPKNKFPFVDFQPL